MMYLYLYICTIIYIYTKQRAKSFPNVRSLVSFRMGHGPNGPMVLVGVLENAATANSSQSSGRNYTYVYMYIYIPVVVHI